MTSGNKWPPADQGGWEPFAVSGRVPADEAQERKSRGGLVEMGGQVLPGEKSGQQGQLGTQSAITAVHRRRSYAHFVVQLFDDPFDNRRDRTRRISPVTRRDIFDYLRTEGGPWWGRLGEVAFLARLYDLEKLPSTDGRFKTADGDIRQHRVANYDWEDDWVFDDPRFRLASGPDEVLLGFLAQMVHPVVHSTFAFLAGCSSRS